MKKENIVLKTISTTFLMIYEIFKICIPIFVFIIFVKQDGIISLGDKVMGTIGIISLIFKYIESRKNE